MRAQLVPLDGTPPLEISKEMTIVGRKEECDLRLEHKGVSKMHCVLVKTDGLLLLRDLGSTNGTRVNGQRVRRAALLPNDQLTIAGFGFRVALGPSERPGSPGEATQEMGTDEIADLDHSAEPIAGEPVSRGKDVPLKVNVLPDVYPHKDQEKKDHA